MLIHATNITGVGASHVVTSFLDAAAENVIFKDSLVFLPSEGPLSDYNPKIGTVIRYKRRFSNSISRFIECFFPGLWFPKIENLIVLGDIPLRGFKNQIVLVHQPNLINPVVNRFSSRSFLYIVFRWIFRRNLKYAKKIIVQTGAMAYDMGRSYPEILEKIIVIPQPAPNWFDKNKPLRNLTNSNNKTLLFYPAAGYPHKNHSFLNEINRYIINNPASVDRSFEIWLTLTEKEFEPYKEISFCRNLGRLRPEEVLSFYGKAHCLLFLSLIESFGLPLIEAMKCNLPVLCIDQPYSRWVCEDTAYYFDCCLVQSFFDALAKLKEDSTKGINYNNALNKFPSSWNEVVSEFVKNL